MPCEPIFMVIGLWLLFANIGLMIIAYKHHQELDMMYTQTIRFTNLIDDFLVRIKVLNDKISKLEKNESS